MMTNQEFVKALREATDEHFSQYGYSGDCIQDNGDDEPTIHGSTPVYFHQYSEGRFGYSYYVDPENGREGYYSEQLYYDNLKDLLDEALPIYTWN